MVSRLSGEGHAVNRLAPEPANLPFPFVLGRHGQDDCRRRPSCIDRCRAHFAAQTGQAACAVEARGQGAEVIIPAAAAAEPPQAVRIMECHVPAGAADPHNMVPGCSLEHASGDPQPILIATHFGTNGEQIRRMQALWRRVQFSPTQRERGRFPAPARRARPHASPSASLVGFYAVRLPLAHDWKRDLPRIDDVSALRDRATQNDARKCISVGTAIARARLARTLRFPPWQPWAAQPPLRAGASGASFRLCGASSRAPGEAKRA